MILSHPEQYHISTTRIVLCMLRIVGELSFRELMDFVKVTDWYLGLLTRCSQHACLQDHGDTKLSKYFASFLRTPKSAEEASEMAQYMIVPD